MTRKQRPAKLRLMDMSLKEYRAFLVERQALSERLSEQNAAFYKEQAKRAKK
jgi:hypothetical protein